MREGWNGLDLGKALEAEAAAINAELPLVRRSERNLYRATLIGYQRQRRTLQAFEDNIANDVRADVRSEARQRRGRHHTTIAPSRPVPLPAGPSCFATFGNR